MQQSIFSKSLCVLLSLLLSVSSFASTGSEKNPVTITGPDESAIAIYQQSKYNTVSLVLTCVSKNSEGEGDKAACASYQVIERRVYQRNDVREVEQRSVTGVIPKDKLELVFLRAKNMVSHSLPRPDYVFGGITGGVLLTMLFLPFMLPLAPVAVPILIGLDLVAMTVAIPAVSYHLIQQERVNSNWSRIVERVGRGKEFRPVKAKKASVIEVISLALESAYDSLETL